MTRSDELPPGVPTRLRTFVERAERAEADLVYTDTLLPLSRPPRLVVAVSLAARASVLWLVIAVIMALRPGARRRAATRGATALAAATVASHLLDKLVGRRRPRAATMPARRALPEHPSSSAFPSCHATSAAAFATAVALEAPLLGAALAPVAVLVAYSRVRTRIHWPSDVVVGGLLGVLTALLTRRRTRSS